MVTPSTSGSSSTRSRQSAGPMSQKWHSELLGTCLGPRVCRQPAHEGPEVLYELAGRRFRRNLHRVSGVHDLPADPDVPILWQGQGQGVLVDHDLHTVPGLFPPCLDVDDGGLLSSRTTRSGFPARVATLPFTRKAFWSSTNTRALAQAAQPFAG